jgi:hypothetical protein
MLGALGVPLQAPLLGHGVLQGYRAFLHPLCEVSASACNTRTSAGVA